MPGGDGVTGKVATIQGAVADKVADMAKANPWVMLGVVASMVVGQGTLVTMLLNKATAAEAKSDSAMTMATAMQKSVDAVQKNTDLILQVMLAQGKVIVDTVVVRDTTVVDSTKADSIRPR